MFVSRGLVVGFTVALAGVLLAGCGTRLNKAPVEDRGTSSNHASSPSVQPGTVVATPIKPLPGAENAGKPGYYTVKPGDTLIRIGLETGQGWKDIARWNNLENPNLIEVGQVLRVTSTVPAPPSAAAAAVAADTGVVTRPVASSSIAPAPPLPARQVHLRRLFLRPPPPHRRLRHQPRRPLLRQPLRATKMSLSSGPLPARYWLGLMRCETKAMTSPAKPVTLCWPQQTDVWCTQARVCVVMAT
jgi:LysM repeat protein